MTWTLAVDAVVPGCARAARVAVDRPFAGPVRPASHRRAGREEPLVPRACPPWTATSSRAAPYPPRPQQPASARWRDAPDARGGVVALAEWSFDPGRDV